MMRHFFSIGFLFFCMMCADSALGASLDEREQELLRRTSHDFRQRVTQWEEYRQAEHSTWKENHEERRGLRRRCRFEMDRAAGAEQILIHAMECLRGELSLDVEYFRKQKAYIELLPHTDDIPRQDALKQIDEYIGTVTTLIEALEFQVYGSLEQLRDAKKTLFERYRAPLNLSLIKVRANVLGKWSSHLQGRAQSLLAGGLHEDVRGILLRAPDCFMRESTNIELIIASQEYLSTTRLFRQTQTGMLHCSGLLRSALETKIQIEQEEKSAREAKEREELEQGIVRKGIRYPEGIPRVRETGTE